MINNRPTVIVNRNEIRYFKYKFENFSLLKIKPTIIIKKGFTNSIGWNLGKKNRSIHLLEPLTSAPMIGTSDKKNKVNMKRIKENLKIFFWLIDEIIKITSIPRRTKKRCLKKNK